MSLRARLVLAAAYLLVVVVIALEVPLAQNIRRRVNNEFESAIAGTAAVVASRISDDVFRAGRNAPAPPTPDPVIAQTALDTARQLAGDFRGLRVVVVDDSGRVLTDSDGEAQVGEVYATDMRPEFREAMTGEGGVVRRRRFSETLGDEILYVVAPVFHERSVAGAVRISTPTSTVDERVRRSWLGLGLIGLGVVAIGLTLAWFLASSLARPVRRLEETAVALGRGNLGARARPEGPKEVATLARSFNRMASTLSANIEAQRDFVANASHQLRTPLTGLRLRLEAIEAEGGFPGEQAEKAQTELDRLSKLVRDLLDLAKASTITTTGTTVELTELARSAADRWTAPAEAAGKRIRLELEGVPTIWADPADLNHVADNLIENAIRYTPEGTEITIEAGARDGVPVLVVSDDGPGIPPHDRARIFDRFYRGTNGRRAGPGTGLGLAIVQELVRRWGGDVTLSNREGTCVEAKFPPAAAVP